jgi:hypothetical protein
MRTLSATVNVGRCRWSAARSRRRRTVDRCRSYRDVLTVWDRALRTNDPGGQDQRRYRGGLRRVSLVAVPRGVA